MVRCLVAAFERVVQELSGEPCYGNAEDHERYGVGWIDNVVQQTVMGNRGAVAFVSRQSGCGGEQKA